MESSLCFTVSLHTYLYSFTYSDYLQRIFLILFLITSQLVLAQQERPTVPEKSTPINDSIPIPQDSIYVGIDSLGVGLDSIPDKKEYSIQGSYTISKDSLLAEVKYGAVDSNYMDVVHNELHLYGDAYIEYLDMQINAAYIKLDLENDLAYAYKNVDSLGQKLDLATFKNTDSNVNYDKLKFNFKTKKGIVENAISKEGEFFLHGNRTKFISKDSDTLLVDDQIFNEDAVITTCNHKYPHFGIKCTKLKVVPDKLAVMGPSNLQIAGIPTPIVLPFGFFPLIKGRSSGLIFPKDFTYDRELGLTFRDIGYYFTISDYLDLRLVGDIYTNGSFAVRAQSTYNKRYAYKGRIELGYSRIRRESPVDASIEVAKSFSLRLSQEQAAGAHPYRRIGGSINIQSNKYNQRNFLDYQNQFENKLRSNFNYSHSLPGTPFSFAMGLAHDQDNQTGKVNISFPNVTLNMNTIYPFKRKNQGSNEEKWYEKINMRYNGAFKNYVQTTDSTIFTKQVLDDMQLGFSHDVTTSASFRVAKYFNVTPSVNYDELWYFRTFNKEYDPTLILTEGDTIITPEGVAIPRVDTTYGTFNDEFVNGFDTYRSFSTSVNVSTQIFGTKQFKKGWLRGVRHVMKPTIGFTYSPDTKSKYLREVSTAPYEEFISPAEYSPFQGGLFTAPLRDKSMSITYGISNLFEAKYFSKKDSTAKKFKLFNSINVNGNYNFAADSLKWSDVRVSGNTQLIKGVTNFNFGLNYTPYVKENGRRINQSVWDKKRRPLAFDGFTATFSTNLTAKKIIGWLSGKKDTKKRKDKDKKKKGPELPAFSELFENLRVSHTFMFGVNRIEERDTFTVGVNSIRLTGSIPLSKNWNMSFSNIAYDIKNKSFVYPSFSFQRDLHCWHMNFSWVPVRGVYGFFIGVKSNTLNFIKADYNQNNSSRFF